MLILKNIILTHFQEKSRIKKKSKSLSSSEAGSKTKKNQIKGLKMLKRLKMSKMPSGVDRNCVHIQIISNKDRSLSLEGTQYDQYGRRPLRMDVHLHVLIFQPLITASNFPINTTVNNQSTRAQVWVALSPSVVCCGRHKAAAQAPSLVWQEPGLHP